MLWGPESGIGGTTARQAPCYGRRESVPLSVPDRAPRPRHPAQPRRIGCRPVLRPDRARRKGPLRRPRLRVQSSHWNKNRSEVRKSHPDSQDFQQVLIGRLRTAEKAATAELGARGRNATPDEIKDAVALALHPPAAAVSTGIVAYGRTLQKGKESAGKLGTAKVYGTALRHFEDSLKLDRLSGADISFADLTSALLSRHEERLNALGYKQNYIGKQLRTLRAIVRRAKSDGLPGAVTAVDAVQTIKIRVEKVQKRRLARDEVRKMEALVGTVSGRRADVLDWWVFAFYAGGMRIGDVVGLQWSSVQWTGNPAAGGRPAHVQWKMQKTGDEIGIDLRPAAADILVRWWSRTGHAPFVFGLLTLEEEHDPALLFKRTASRSAQARTELKKLAALAEVPYVGFHGARHSMADNLLKAGVPVATISQTMGHSSTQTTTNYLSSFDREAVSDALRALD